MTLHSRTFSCCTLLGKIVGYAAIVLLFFGTLSVAGAQSGRSVLSDLVRGTVRVAEDVPIKKVDELVEGLAKSRAAREAVDAELRKAGQLAGKDLVSGTARSEAVLQLLRLATSEVDPAVLRRLENLDDATRDVALVLARGGDEFAKTLPDLATRGRLVREGGAETVAAAGMFGPEAARAAIRLDEGIRGGSILIKGGTRAITVADFGSVMSRYGEASWKFWKEYIQPHWKLWAASGALAAYLANPEYFQDAAGSLTEAGFKHLTGLVGEVSAGAIRGVGKGAGHAIEKLVNAVCDTFINPEKRLYAILGTLVVLILIGLMFRRLRYWLFWPLRWMNRLPSEADPRKPKTHGG